MTELEKVPFDMKLEVVVLGVSDVDRTNSFYENLGWQVDSRPLQSSSARRRSTTTATRRRTPSTTGGTGTRLT